MSIRRANPSVNYDEYDKPYPDMIDDPEGSFVHYADHLDELRACEVRMQAGTRRMVDAALGAAQLRVEIQLRRNGVGESEIRLALAAIDALRGESK